MRPQRLLNALFFAMTAALILQICHSSRKALSTFPLTVVHAQSAPCSAAQISDSDRAWCAFEQLVRAVHSNNMGAVDTSLPSWRSLCEVAPNQCPINAKAPAGALRSRANSRVRMLAHSAPLSTVVGQPDVNTSLFTSVFYSPLAAPIISNCAMQNCTQGLTFPAGSVIARINWLALKADSCSKIKVFRAPDDIVDYTPSGIITIDTHTTALSCRATSGIPVYPLSKFLYVQRSNVTPGAFSTRFSPQLKGNDTIALIVAFNLMQKVNADWTWSTFWWSLTPGVGGRAGTACSSPVPCSTIDPREGQSTQLSNYVMNLVSTTLKPNDPFVAVSNPYLDGKTGVKANCIVCHSFAMTPMAYGAGVPASNLCGAQDAQSFTPARLQLLIDDYQVNQTTGCPVSKRAKTDMVWSVAALAPSCSQGGRACVTFPPVTVRH